MKQCSKCKSIYEDSWVTCINCGDKWAKSLPVNTDEKFGKKVVRELYKKVGKDSKEINQLLIPDAKFYHCHNDVTLIPQIMGRQILEYLKMPVRSVVASFGGNFNCPGRVETSGYDYFIEISSEHRNNFRSIGAIIAHEATHVYMKEKGLYYTDTKENEMATDIVAITLGLGLLMLNGFSEKIEHKTNLLGEETISHRKFFGYLDPTDAGYFAAYRILTCGFDKEKAVNALTNIAKEYYSAGFFRASSEIDRYHKDLKRYKWVRRKFINLYNKIKLLNYNSSNISSGFMGLDFNIEYPRSIFTCLVCNQKMKIPLHHQKIISITCPVCGTIATIDLRGLW